MWEYKIQSFAVKKSLLSMGGEFDENEIAEVCSELGRQNWELVSMATPSKGFGESRSIIAVFKRPA